MLLTNLIYYFDQIELDVGDVYAAANYCLEMLKERNTEFNMTCWTNDSNEFYKKITTSWIFEDLIENDDLKVVLHKTNPSEKYEIYFEFHVDE